MQWLLDLAKSTASARKEMVHKEYLEFGHITFPVYSIIQ